jgi:hypothetical protein
MKCPKCGTRMEMDRSKVFTSIPPQYRFKCPNCGCLKFCTADRDYDGSDEDNSSNKNTSYHMVTIESLHDVFQNAMDIAKLHSEQSIDPNKTYYEQALRIFKCLRDATFDYITKDEMLTPEQLRRSFQKIYDINEAAGVLSYEDSQTKIEPLPV